MNVIHRAVWIALWLIVGLGVSLRLVYGQCPGGACPGGQCPLPSSASVVQWPPAQRPQAQRAAVPYPALVLVACGVPGVPGSAERYVGSGVVVDREEGQGQTVLTCAHGYKSGMAVTVHTQQGKSYAARILGVDAVQDVMSLAIDDAGIAPMRLATEAPRLGEGVYVCGFAGDTFSGYMGQWGTLKQFISPDGGSAYSFVDTTCVSRSGCSGGPVLNARGEIIATITGCGNGSGTVGPCLPLVRRLLKFVLPPYADHRAARESSAIAAVAQGGDNSPPGRQANDPARAGPLEKTDATPTMLPYDDSSVVAELEAIRRRITPLENSLAEDGPLRTEVRRIDGRIDVAASIAADSKTGPLRKALAGIPKLDDVREAARIAAVGAARAALAEHVPVAAAVAPAASSTLQTAIVALGVSSPVAGVGLLLATWLGRRTARRIAARVVHEIPAASRPAEYSANAKTVVVTRENPPPPQQVIREQTFVSYAERDPQVVAMQRAQAELLQKSPGARATIDTLNEYASQILSGLRKDQQG